MNFSILVAEDDPNILISIEFLLSNAGYRVITASDGARAWELLLERRPHLAVLDIMLPEIDGYDLCTRIRGASALQATRVLILSARGGTMEMEKGVQRGADACMRKPFGTRDFLDTIARLLAAQRAA